MATTQATTVQFTATIIQNASATRVKSNGKLFCYLGFETLHNGKPLTGLAMYTLSDDGSTPPAVGDVVNVFMDKAPEGAPFKYSFTIGKPSITLSSDNDWDAIFG